MERSHVVQFHSCRLTTVGTNGGFTRRNNSSSHWMVRKNACFLTSSASRSLEPKRRSGFLRSSCKRQIEMAIIKVLNQDCVRGTTGNGICIYNFLDHKYTQVSKSKPGGGGYTFYCRYYKIWIHKCLLNKISEYKNAFACHTIPKAHSYYWHTCHCHCYYPKFHFLLQCFTLVPSTALQIPNFLEDSITISCFTNASEFFTH